MDLNDFSFLYAGWPVLLPLTIVTVGIATAAVRSRSVKVVILGMAGLLFALAVFSMIPGGVEPGAQRHPVGLDALVAIIFVVPTLVATGTTAIVGVRRKSNPIDVGLVTFIVGMLVLPAGTVLGFWANCRWIGGCL